MVTFLSLLQAAVRMLQRRRNETLFPVINFGLKNKFERCLQRSRLLKLIFRKQLIKNWHQFGIRIYVPFLMHPINPTGLSNPLSLSQ